MSSKPTRATEEDPKDSETNDDLVHRIQNVERVSQTVRSLNCISQDPMAEEHGELSTLKGLSGWFM